MLRRKPDNSFEYRHVELALLSARPAPLSAERRDALRLRIMANLGPQEAAAPRGIFRERWISIPAGVGIAAAIIAAAQYVTPEGGHDSQAITAQAVGEVLIDGQVGETARQGQSIVARSAAWIGIAEDVRVGMEPGASISFAESSGGLVVAHHAGAVTIVSGSNGVRVEGAGWSAAVAAFSVMKATPSSSALLLAMEDGTASITASGRSYSLSVDNGPLVLPLPDSTPTGSKRPESDVPPVQPITNAEAPAAPPAGVAPPVANPAPGTGSAVVPVPGADGTAGSGGASETQPNGGGSSSDAPGQTGAGNSANAPGQADPPANSGNPPGQANSPVAGDPPGHADPPGNSADAPGHADPPGASGTTPAHGETPGSANAAPPEPPAAPPAGNGPPAAPGNSGGTPPGGGAPSAPGNSGNAPGHTKGGTDSAQPGNSGSNPNAHANSSGSNAASPGNSAAAPGQANGPANNAAPKANSVKSNNGNAGHEKDDKPPKLPPASQKKGRPA